LADDHLQVNQRLVTIRDSNDSGAVRVHGVSARAKAPAQRTVAVVGDCVNLREIPFAVVRLFSDSIDQQGGTF
jgi:hypothetical protein